MLLRRRWACRHTQTWTLCCSLPNMKQYGPSMSIHVAGGGRPGGVGQGRSDIWISSSHLIFLAALHAVSITACRLQLLMATLVQ
mmetsp:Transcript_124600/g.311606  ORF Transcript_124600/g.311606 Transcript_124600/m.311606 type:complete len:84 (-) Transcript_124600:103-354(-)